MRKILSILLIAMLFLAFSGCDNKKTLHCDNCNKEVKVDKDSSMEEEWTVFCNDCNDELFSGDPLLGGD